MYDKEHDGVVQLLVHVSDTLRRQQADVLNIEEAAVHEARLTDSVADAAKAFRLSSASRDRKYASSERFASTSSRAVGF